MGLFGALNLKANMAAAQNLATLIFSLGIAEELKKLDRADSKVTMLLLNKYLDKVFDETFEILVMFNESKDGRKNAENRVGHARTQIANQLASHHLNTGSYDPIEFFNSMERTIRHLAQDLKNSIINNHLPYGKDAGNEFLIIAEKFLKNNYDQSET
jgi:hypothetical protein